MGILDILKKAAKHGVSNEINNTASNAKYDVSHKIGEAVGDLTDKAKDGIKNAIQNKSKNFKFDKLPATLEELKELPEAKLTDYFSTAALAVIALDVCSTNFAEGERMLDFLNGPNTFSDSDRQFIKGQFMDGRNYIARSYFKGATPENNYTPSEPFKIEVSETPHSKDAYDEGYITLYLESGGADGLRPIQLRTKKSTGEWFVNDYRGVLAGIRKSKDQDEWA